jgi:uncharacterized protein YcgI (DUF1989 family)
VNDHEVAVQLNQQQLELLDRTLSEQPEANRPELLIRALREYHAEHIGNSAPGTGSEPPRRDARQVPTQSGDRKLLFETVMEPGTGKAVEVSRGEVLRIEQVGDGGQCADFNLFNLHDYKEHFHTARTRHMHGLMPSEGAFLWSAPPRDRPMAVVVTDTVKSNDILYGRCSAFLYDYQYGLPVHTNCHDIQAEAQREYGLTPDDVHDSFNFFMNTGIDASGNPYIGPNLTGPGDYVEILALIDVLAVANVCGADVMATSNFEFKPLRVAKYQATPQELEAQERRPETRPLSTQRDPSQFRVSAIKATRELARDPSYAPDFTNVPITVQSVPVRLTDGDLARLDHLVESGEFGPTRDQVLRYAFFSWWIEQFMRGPKHFDREAAQA